MVRGTQPAISNVLNWSSTGGLIKRSAISISTLAIVCLGMAVDARAANDRFVVAQFTNGTSTEAGGVHTTLDLTVFNDINNLQFPSHFVQWVQVTVPSGFTGSGAGGAFTTSDFTPPSGWQVSSIAGNVITFISASTDYTFTAGTSRTFLLRVNTPTATACPGTPYMFGVIANQSTSGGKGNTYVYRPKAALPTVTVTNCIIATYLVMNSVLPSSIFTTGSGQNVVLTATLTTLLHDNLGNPVAGTPIANEPLTFSEGSATITCMGPAPVTDSSGAATCTYAPLSGPTTPLTAGNYDESASFAGDQVPFPPYGSTNSSSKQLTVSMTDTSLTVPDVSGPFGGAVTLNATLATGTAQTGVSGQTITFSLNGNVVCGLSGQPPCPATDSNGLATLSGVSIVGIAGGSYPDYIFASFAGNTTYNAVNNKAKLTVTQLGQTISFTGPGDQPLVAGSVGISATALVFNTTTPSNLAVSFDSSTTAAVCSVGIGTLQSDGSTTATVTFYSLGLCTITASQAGNTSYGGATPVSRSFSIVNTLMSCNLGNLSVPYTGSAQSPTCSTTTAGASCGVSIGAKISAGSYPVSSVPSTGYSCSVSDTFVINKVTPTVSWSNPADITYGTALGAAQLNATSVAGNFAYTPASGTVLSAGNGQILSVQFTPTDTTDYNTPAAKNVLINVNKATPTVNWSNPADIIYGTALSSTQLNATFTAVVNAATITVAGTPTYSPVTGTVLSAGNSQALGVTFAPNDTTNYNSASATVHINVNKALATVNLSNMSQTFTGNPLSPTVTTTPVGLTLSYTGTDPLPQTNVGSYSVAWMITDPNYYGSASGTFMITGASQTITITSFKINATGGASGQPVTFSLSADSDPTACKVDADGTVEILDITKWGNCHIVLNQAAGGNYSAAPARNTTLVHGSLTPGPANIDATQNYVVPEP
jgi:hypothetical protein